MAETQHAEGDDGWQPTPPERRIRARLASGETVEYQNLKIGDVFQAIAVGGYPVNPLDTFNFDADGNSIDPEEDRETFAIVTAPPVRGYLGNEGWAVEIEVGTRVDLLLRSTN